MLDLEYKFWETYGCLRFIKYDGTGLGKITISTKLLKRIPNNHTKTYTLRFSVIFPFYYTMGENENPLPAEWSNESSTGFWENRAKYCYSYLKTTNKQIMLTWKLNFVKLTFYGLLNQFCVFDTAPASCTSRDQAAKATWERLTHSVNNSPLADWRHT